MKDNPLRVSPKQLKALNSKVIETGFLEETITEKRQKLSNEYKKQLNNLYLFYIEYRNILSSEFKINIKELKQASTMIYDSKIFGSKQQDYLDVIRHFRNKPVSFAELIVEHMGNSVDQYFIDFIVISFYPIYLNNMCGCKQPYNLYMFMRVVVELELADAADWNALLKQAQVTDKIFTTLLKKIDVFNFFKKFVRKLHDSLVFMGQTSESDSPSVSNSEKDKAKSQTIVSNDKTKSNSSKYKAIIESFKSGRAGLNVSMDDRKDTSMHINNKYSRLDLFAQDTMIKLDDEYISLRVLENSLRIMVECIDKFLPPDIKLFFYLLKNVTSKTPGVGFSNIIMLFWFQRFLIQNITKDNLYLQVDNFKDMQISSIGRVLKLLLKYCKLVEDKLVEMDSPFTLLEKALVNIPHKIAEKLLKMQIIDTARIQKKRQDEHSRTEDFSIPNSNYHVISNVSNGESKVHEDYLVKCTYHNEAVCISFRELAMLVEVFSRSDRYCDASLILALTKVLNSNEISSFTDVPLSNDKIFIIFMDGIVERVWTSPKDKNLFIENVLKLGMISNDMIDQFDGSTLKDVLRYYKVFLTGEKDNSTKKMAFYDVYYDLTARKVIIDSKVDVSNGIAVDTKETSSVRTDILNQLAEIELKYNQNREMYHKKLTQLCYKSRELDMVETEIIKYKKFKKEALKQNILAMFMRMTKEVMLDLCLEVPETQKISKNTDMRENFACNTISRCGAPNVGMAWMSKFNTLSDTPPAHNHFIKLEDLLEFLRKFEFSLYYVEDNRYAKMLRGLVSRIRGVLRDKIVDFIDQSLIKEYHSFISEEESVIDLFDEYFSSMINFYLFPPDLTSKDEGFQVSCEILNFVKLEDLSKIKNSDVIERNLSGPIHELRRCAEIRSFKDKIRSVKTCMKKIVSIVKSINGKTPGNEEIHPIFVYCILKAKPPNWLSFSKFLQLCLPDEDQKGENGFIVAQLEVAVRIIESADKHNLKNYNFEKHILENEINMGIHFIRKRENVQMSYPGIQNMDLIQL